LLACLLQGAQIALLEDKVMGEFSIWHWLVVLAVILLLFGGGKVSGLMGDLAKGIKVFKATMAEDKSLAAPPAEEPEEQVRQS
jgi:sec-independent protein translocase protein TatA